MKAALQKILRHSTDLLIDDFDGFCIPKLMSGFQNMYILYITIQFLPLAIIIILPDSSKIPVELIQKLT